MTHEDEEFNRIEREAAMRMEAVRATVAPREWVGLSNGEMIELSEMELGRWDLILEVEAKLQEKNT